MELTADNLTGLYTSFNAAYRRGFNLARPSHEAFTLRVNSGSEAEEYGWMADMPGVRKWVGDRVVNSIKGYKYRLVNDDYELTLGVPKKNIQDDKYGIWTTRFEKFGQQVALAPAEAVYELLNAGETELCWDGQPMFSATHPNGDQPVYSNLLGGAAPAWYWIDTSQIVQPMVFQLREDFDFQAYDNPRDFNVFSKKRFIYGTQARYAAGFGFPQTAIKSRATLNEDNLDAAMTAMAQYKNEHGKPLGTMGGLLLVGPQNRLEALKLRNQTQKANSAGTASESNVLEGTFDVIVTPYLDES